MFEILARGSGDARPNGGRADTDLQRGCAVVAWHDLGALAITYPHRTYVLDDGRREEIGRLVRGIGGRIHCPTDEPARQGWQSEPCLGDDDGELVVCFDADHVAEPHFIDRLVGYFVDERLGFVQTPHAFYNFDAYQGVLNYERGVYWEEGMLFYNVTQPGKNRWNAVTFCGSAACFAARRWKTSD